MPGPIASGAGASGTCKAGEQATGHWAWAKFAAQAELSTASRKGAVAFMATPFVGGFLGGSVRAAAARNPTPGPGRKSPRNEMIAPAEIPTEGRTGRSAKGGRPET